MSLYFGIFRISIVWISNIHCNPLFRSCKVCSRNCCWLISPMPWTRKWSLTFGIFASKITSIIFRHIARYRRSHCLKLFKLGITSKTINITQKVQKPAKFVFFWRGVAFSTLLNSFNVKKYFNFTCQTITYFNSLVLACIYLGKLLFYFAEFQAIWWSNLETGLDPSCLQWMSEIGT